MSKGYKPVGNEPIDNSCPSPEAVIEQYLRQTKRQVPKGMPADPFQAARWWMTKQAPADNFTEAATPPPTKGGDWSTPYHDRLIYTLKKFLRLKSVQQVFVIEYIDKGVPWKGDDIPRYQQYCEEHEKMQLNKEQYIEEGFKKMYRCLKGLQA